MGPDEEHLPVPGEDPSPNGVEPPLICPRCGDNAKTQLATTKRGRTIKCHACGFDGFKAEDFGNRDQMVRLAAHTLKAEFPQFSFIRNLGFPANPLTRRESEQPTRYDYGLWLGPHHLERIRFLTVQGMTPQQYLETPENFLLGLPEVVRYLSSKERDVIFGFHFVDAKEVGLAEAHRMEKFLTKVKDRFGNDQYHIPVEVRHLLILLDHDDKRRLLLRHLSDRMLDFQEVI